MARPKWFRDVEQVENKAWQVLQDFSRQFSEIGQPVPKMPPVPVQDIARLLAGLDLQAIPNLQHEGQRLSGLLEPDIQLISYALEDMPGRQSFSIAHELGHYYLHYLAWVQRQSQPTLFPLEDDTQSDAAANRTYYRCSVEDIDANQRNSGGVGGVDQGDLLEVLRTEQRRARQEAEANWFASALLMPVPFMEDLLRAGYSSPHELAHRLGVSPLAAEVRLVRMGHLEKLDRDRRSDDPKQKRFI
jgi:Zn-dependent peptidase ImmA (M78 family)